MLPFDSTTPPDPSIRLLPPKKEQTLRAKLLAYRSDYGEGILDVEIQQRHFWFRHRYMPWFLSVLSLDGARVLEVGCGTGASTVAFAERGAFVQGTDIDAGVLDIAAVRAELHALSTSITFVQDDAEGAALIDLEDGQYDLVAFCASLEHMTLKERLAVLSCSWKKLKSGGYLSVIDAPNRLWYYDIHTSDHNFYHWLPDDLAIKYAPFTTRESYRTAFTSESFLSDVEPVTRLARYGRGVSYQDFEAALGIRMDALDVTGEWEFRRKAEPAWGENWLKSLAGRFHLLLCEIEPKVPSAFFEPEIAVLIRKP